MFDRIRLFQCVFLFASLFPIGGYAQLEVRCKMETSRYLPFEDILVTLELINQGAREVVIGGDQADAYLSFDIRNNRGERVERRLDKSIKSVTVPPRSSVLRCANLLDYYDLRQIGAYTLRARVEWKDTYYYSANSYLDVVRGDKIAEVISEYEPSGSFRTYTLETIHRDRMESAFLRIEDRNACYGVVSLGKIIKLYKPELMADQSGRIHVLMHTGPASFVQYVIAGDGAVLERRILASEDGMPSMSFDEAGEVHVGQAFEEE